METAPEQQIKRGAHSHTPEEKEWAKEKIREHGIGQKSIRENNLLDEYSEKFGKTLKAVGMYAWFKYIDDPEYKKRRKYTPRTKESKEQEVFTKSTYIAYINGVMAGYESKDDLIRVMEENKILSNEVKVFKSVPIEINYSVSF